MKLVVGSDHAGYTMKEYLKDFLYQEGWVVEDRGTTSLKRVDYPCFAREVAQAVSSGKFERGILICGTGIGMSITANKVPGIRAALCHDPVSARLSRNHNDANILALGERIIGQEVAQEIVRVWLKAPFFGGRHQERIFMLEKWEQEMEGLHKGKEEKCHE